MSSSFKMTSQRRNYNEEFNLNIRFIQNEISSLVDSNNNELNIITVNKQISECLRRLNQLLTNDYFNFMFVNNMIVKDFTLKFIQKIIKSDYQKIFKLETLRILEQLIGWDSNEEGDFCRNDMSSIQYKEFFLDIIPELKNLLLQSLITPNLEQNRQFSSSSSLLMITEPKVLLNLNKLICYLFTAVSFGHLIQIEFVPKCLDYLFDQLVSPLIFSQLMFSISKNLCELNATKSERQIDEFFKLGIHERCVTKTVELLEINVKNETNRNLLKKSLNNYCNYVRMHLVELTGIDYNNEQSAPVELPDDTENMTIDQKWQQCLYKIVIGIVRILRLEFDNSQNNVEIELIIYFYELLLENLSSLTSSDSISISDKLMPVIVKINNWRENKFVTHTFSSEQNDFLKSLSFKLADKFMLILKSNFVELIPTNENTHWNLYESIWVRSIKEWYPISFKMISTFCRTNKKINFFKHVQFLSTTILNSWLENENQHKNGGFCICGLRPKKNPKLFLGHEILDSIIDLTHFFDYVINIEINKHCALNHFFSDVYPLINVVSGLFLNLKTKRKLILFNNFFTRLFDLKSQELKQSSYWKNHLILIIKKLESLNQCYYDFEISEDVFETTLNLIQSITDFFPLNDLIIYQATIQEVLSLVNAESSINYSVANELNKFYNV